MSFRSNQHWFFSPCSTVAPHRPCWVGSLRKQALGSRRIFLCRLRDCRQGGGRVLWPCLESLLLLSLLGIAFPPCPLLLCPNPLPTCLFNCLSYVTKIKRKRKVWLGQVARGEKNSSSGSSDHTMPKAGASEIPKQTFILALSTTSWPWLWESDLSPRLQVRTQAQGLSLRRHH